MEIETKTIKIGIVLHKLIRCSTVFEWKLARLQYGIAGYIYMEASRDSINAHKF